MFRPNTVIVHGAGASYELGFPLGRELKDEISSLLHWPRPHEANRNKRKPPSNMEFFKAVYPHISDSYWGAGNQFYNSPEILAYWSSWQQIRNGIPFASSIDNFLHMRQDEPEIIRISKAAICKAIAVCEGELPTARADQQTFDPHTWLMNARILVDGRKQPAWTTYFSEICFSGAPHEKVSEALDRIRIISFNYDRLIEQLVELAVRFLYNLEPAASQVLASQLKVLHPYGCLGQIFDKKNGVPWGTHATDIAQAPGILTFSESEKSTQTAEMQEWLRDADRIIFLGFGYHPQNIELLASKATRRDVRVLGTARGMSNESIGAARKKLARSLAIQNDGLAATDPMSSIQLKPITCAELMFEQQVHLME